MTEEQANAMATAIRDTNKISDVRVEQHGGEFAVPTNPWKVELWSVNAAAGNRNLYVIRDYDLSAVESHIRAAKGKATARDKAAFFRHAVSKEMDRE